MLPRPRCSDEDLSSLDYADSYSAQNISPFSTITRLDSPESTFTKVMPLLLLWLACVGDHKCRIHRKDLTKAMAEGAQDRLVLVVMRVIRPPHRRPVP